MDDSYRSKVELPRFLSLGMPISFLIMDISNNRMSATIKNLRFFENYSEAQVSTSSLAKALLAFVGMNEAIFLLLIKTSIFFAFPR